MNLNLEVINEVEWATEKEIEEKRERDFDEMWSLAMGIDPARFSLKMLEGEQ